MKKNEIMRGRNLFRLVAVKGRRTDGVLLRCTYLVQDRRGARLQTAFKVPSKVLNAVRRNRIRRLMKEGMKSGQAILVGVLEEMDCCMRMILSYKGGKEIQVGRLKLPAIQTDIETICRAIAGKLR